MPEAASHYEATPLAEKSVSDIQHEVFERLDYKVGAVLDLKKNITGLNDDAGPEEVHEVLTQSWLTVRSMFPSETIGRFEQLQNSQPRLKELQTTADQIRDDVTKEFDASAWRSTQTEIQHVRREQVALLENNDIQFLLNIQSVIQTLQKKNNDVEGLRDQPDLIIAELNAHKNKEEARSADVVKFRQTPFDISIVLKPAAYQRIRGPKENSAGMHYEKSIINIIRDDAETDKSIDHEHVHTLLDGAYGVGEYMQSSIYDVVEDYPTTNNPEKKDKMMQMILQLNPSKLLDLMQNEMVAHIEEWETLPLNQDRPDVVPGVDRNRPRSFRYHAHNFSSAGTNAGDIVGLLAAAAKDSPDAASRQLLQQKSDEFQRRFRQAAEFMRSALRLARQQGEAAVDALHALLIVLPPSRYSFLERYVREKYA